MNMRSDEMDGMGWDARRSLPETTFDDTRFSPSTEIFGGKRMEEEAVTEDEDTHHIYGPSHRIHSDTKNDEEGKDTKEKKEN